MRPTNIFYVFSLFFLAGTLEAMANTRSVYFTQTARNTSTNGLQSAAQARCRIIISNPSSAAQEYSATITANATGTAAGAASGSATSIGWTALAAGAVVQLEYVYPSYPARPTVTSGSQVVICSGTINARNAVAGTPGFVIASGMLRIFSEAALLSTTVMTGVTTFGGQAVFSQMPIIINSQRPF
jgi:hypothetical protein